MTRIWSQFIVLVAVLLLSLATSHATPPAHTYSRARRQRKKPRSHEPTLAQTRAAALRYAGLEKTRWKGWARRSRLSGLLPTLTLRSSRDRGEDRNHTRQTSGAERLQLGTDSARIFEARAVWQLDRLIFDPSELRAAQTGERLHRERLAISSQVTSLYYQRRRVELELQSATGAEPLARAQLRLRHAELTGQLDALTGGYFVRATK